tara:strand:+ start:5291 stop:5731 length:441 start_codon:yes stop_codon:yes gene_type:complete
MRIAVLILGLLLCAALRASDLPAGAIQISADQIPWKEGPPSLPKGSKVAVLEGNPGKSGIFTLRVRAPAGARVAAHTHPKPERVTIISGAVGVGFGDYYDQTKLRVFRTGDYYLTPPGIPHFLSFAEDSVVQITGNGPWLVTPVSP